jgi:alpha-amylase
MRKPDIKFLFLTLILANTHADVILHAFNWKYKDIEANAGIIQKAGYRKVLISPPLKTIDNEEWWGRYQPLDIRVIDSPLGNKDNLSSLIKKLNQYGIDTYADVVLNHMANETFIDNNTLNYPGNIVLQRYQHNKAYYENQKLFGDLSVNIFSAADFHKPFCIKDWTDIYQVQEGRLCGHDPDKGLPDLTEDSNNVIKNQQEYLKALRKMGIKGFRVDAAKHMSNKQINNVFTQEITNGMHVFGEIITSGGKNTIEYDKFLKPYLDNNKTHGAYDFPLFATIRSAFTYGGDMSLLVHPLSRNQALPNDKAITFTITHDIPTNQEFRYQIMDPTDEKLAYAYILGRDGGVPMVYSDHNETKDNRWNGYFNQENIKAMIKFHNVMQGSPMQYLSYNQCYILFGRFSQDQNIKGIVGINKCNFEQNISIDTTKYSLYKGRNYIDVLDNKDIINVTNATFTLKIPARTAKMLLAS